MSLGGSNKIVKDAKDKLMINFDPTKCLLDDLRVSTAQLTTSTYFDAALDTKISDSQIDLQKEFPDTFEVWYDSIGGDAIGLTWKRSSKVLK